MYLSSSILGIFIPNHQFADVALAYLENIGKVYVTSYHIITTSFILLLKKKQIGGEYVNVWFLFIIKKKSSEKII